MGIKLVGFIYFIYLYKMFNKNEFNKSLNYILRRHKHKMSNIERYSRNRSLDQGQTPIYEYGIKWGGGDIGIRIFKNESVARVYCHIGNISDYITIDYYDGDDFVFNNNTIIKELIMNVEYQFLTSDLNYTWN